jgi:F-type H+-transporting ATPase subunit gamma
VKQILPVVPEPTTGTAVTKAGAHAEAAAESTDYLYEPDKQVLLNRLVPLYVQILLYRAALESITSFFASQMTAMENATKNAGDMISALTLQFNRARQASITKELAEIVGGAEALKG